MIPISRTYIYVYGYRQNWGEVGKERMFESAIDLLIKE